MATNYIQPVDVISLTAPYAVASGAGLLVGSLFGGFDAGAGKEVVLTFPNGAGIKFDGQTMAFFSTAADLASWIKTTLTTLDIEAGIIPRPELRTHDNEPLPSILHEDPARLIEKKPGRLWRVFAGGKA